MTGWLLPDDQPFLFDAVAASGWRSEPLDAVVNDIPCATLSPALPKQWTHLAGSFQGVPCPGRRALSDCTAIYRTQPLRANMADHSQDWECSSLKPTKCSCPDGLLSDGPLSKSLQMDSVRESNRDRNGTAVRSPQCAKGDSIRST